ncbi:LysR family transcriptional regulator ArgP [Phaeobacter sp. QD34_3]|uniref:LysR family transcriptional regulator ArgP n=1 Tax=unclassified Phaeobacter TaxID=2621772 RepID=UPI00237EED21|nr:MULTISPECIES: LysR family transcriptional regulator ArgP [unclassified Phaeobacter]MDE4131925.1 LysR family transcriptional regulator ArgP [Phaeobacter sp. QD34_3]MDE4135563.1 LysR family transcriptional regulator ArgP [Phaeobacter sp. QD34_24]MDE4173552.1 LysR family transcriptional regulator ArgP [Phaeobacter sp. PT47_59]
MQFVPNQLAALRSVLRHGSFEAAAQSLGVTASAISQRVKALEDRTGTALVHRGPPSTGTAAGLRLAKHAEDVALLEDQVARDLALSAPGSAAQLRCAINADSLATWFIPAMAACPDLLFDLVIDDQDHSADWLRRGEVSAAVTCGNKPVGGCTLHDLGALRYVATASPSFVARWLAEGVTTTTLSAAPCLVFNAKDALQRRWMETYVAPGLAPPAHFLPSSQAFIEAAKAGLGWGMNPLSLVQDALAAGDLVELVPGTPLDVPLGWQVSRVMAAALGPATRAIVRTARQHLLQ